MTAPDPAGHVVLVGLMGSGKSTVAEVLAERLGRPILDNDALLEQRTGATAADLESNVGADELHRLEREVLATALDREEPAVITAAASVVDEPRTAALLDAHTVVWLTGQTGTLASRIDGSDGRPFVGGDTAATLRAQARRRNPQYARIADATVDTTALDPAEVTERILTRLTARDTRSV